MIYWDRHEIDIRGEIQVVLDVYKVNSLLVGFPEQIAEDFVVIRKDALPYITDEIYKMMLREMEKHARRSQQN